MTWQLLWNTAGQFLNAESFQSMKAMKRKPVHHELPYYPEQEAFSYE